MSSAKGGSATLLSSVFPLDVQNPMAQLYIEPGAELLIPGGIDIVVSPSQVGAWQECRRKWWYRYVARVKGPAKLSLAWGSAMHQVFEEYNKGATYEELFDGGGASRCIEIGIKHLEPVPDIKLEDELKRLEEITSRYLENDRKRLDHPEEDRSVYLFTMQLHGIDKEHWPRVFMRGITDGKVVKPGNPGPQAVVVDYKSAAKRWSSGQSDQEAQPDFYALREHLLHGAEEVELLHEIILKNGAKCKACRGKGCDKVQSPSLGLEACEDGQVWVQRWSTTRGRDHMNRAVQAIVAFAISRALTGNSEALHPTSPGYGQRNCGICDFKAECPVYFGTGAEAKAAPPPWAPEVAYE